MKYSAAIILAVTGFAAASPHSHRHQHLHAKKEAAPVDVTKIVYELNGQTIPEAEVLEGISNGTLVWGAGGAPAPAPAPSPVSTPAAIPDIQAAQVKAPEKETPKVETPAPAPQTSEAPKPSSAPAPKPAQSEFNGDFPDYDNSLSCGEFPDKFGPVALNYLGLNGFAGIQQPKSILASGFADIFTLKSGMFSTGGDYEGAYFSYACPIGSQNVQWPSTQGATKQSVGGLLCKDGKLTLTRGDVTKKLCDNGTDKVTIKIKNTMNKGAAVCRTNYPGPEDETIPTFVDAGNEAKLACPDAADYYTWDNKPTSAQLYVNNAGVSQEEGCQWGEEGSGMGNFAPLNLGVGYSGGKAWISIFQNAPTTDDKLDFSIKIEGDDKNGNCMYDASKKQYCSGNDYNDCNDHGCTVAVMSGTATYVFS